MTILILQKNNKNLYNVMKKIVFGFIAMFVATMMLTSCGGNKTVTNDSVDVDTVETVDSVCVDTLAADSVVAE